jgi:hypothetical protein
MPTPATRDGSPESPVDLGPATSALLAKLGVPVRAAVALPGSWPAGPPHGSFRLDLMDGRTVKLRQSISADRSRSYSLLVRDVGDPRLVRVLARRLDLTLEEWVPGASLESTPIRGAHVTAGAALLGSLHAVERVRARPVKETVSTQPVREALEADLRTLRDVGSIDEDRARQLLAAAAGHDPCVAAASVIHKDLCPENLVVDSHGALRAVDNEWMTIGPTGFDLARTWYRWPMSDPTWRTFLSAYARFVDPGPALAHFTFWRIAVVSKSARVRVTRRLPAADVPLRCLAALADEA